MKTTTRHRFLNETITTIPGYLDVNRNGVDGFGTIYTSGNSRGVSTPGIFAFTFNQRDSIWLASAKMECEVENGLIQCVDTDDVSPNYVFRVEVGLMNPAYPPDHINLRNLHFRGFEKIECRHKPVFSPFVLGPEPQFPNIRDPNINYVVPYFRLMVYPSTTGLETGHVFKTDLLDPSLLNRQVSYSIVCEWEHSFQPNGM